ncbi:hypothetical protein RRF57_012834 [Xylaria bambusicola]|uniref:Uncharacterized protein n=1 Tax=Xylaria bambusicola TaxID=326684 RepID=A0AAN7UVW5_9PEZI
MLAAANDKVVWDKKKRRDCWMILQAPSPAPEFGDQVSMSQRLSKFRIGAVSKYDFDLTDNSFG